MKILVACEYSGTVRDAFTEKGHDAWSCDLLPSNTPGNHYQGDIRDILYREPWDLLIAHPPCTYLSYAGTHCWNDPGRLQKRLDALNFFALLWEAPIERICIENPKGCASPTIAKYTQEIQPWYFGDREYKTTWLWLKNLPPLVHIKHDGLFDVATHTAKPEPKAFNKNGKALHFTEYRHFTEDRGLIRAKTFPGIARAMAEQWGVAVGCSPAKI